MKPKLSCLSLFLCHAASTTLENSVDHPDDDAEDDDEDDQENDEDDYPGLRPDVLHPVARVEPVEPGADTVETTGVTAPVRVGVDGELVSWAGAECSHVVADAGQLLGDGLVVVGQGLQTNLDLH